MATNKRDLRAYVRYDGTGRIIPGSLVLRRSKPKVGDWKEIQTYECCDDFIILSSEFQEGLWDNIFFRFFCEDNIAFEIVGSMFYQNNLPPFTMNDVYPNISESFSFFGEWSIENTRITIKLKKDIANAMCPNGKVTLAILSIISPP